MSLKDSGSEVGGVTEFVSGQKPGKPGDLSLGTLGLAIYGAKASIYVLCNLA